MELKDPLDPIPHRLQRIEEKLDALLRQTVPPPPAPTYATMETAQEAQYRRQTSQMTSSSPSSPSSTRGGEDLVSSTVSNAEAPTGA